MAGAAPATAPWLTDQEKEWIRRELARDAALIGDPVRHNLLAAFANPRVLLLGLLGLLANGAGNGLLLSAPAVLIAGTGLETMQVGSLVSIGGGLGVVCILIAGWNPDRRGDRLPRLAAVGGRRHNTTLRLKRRRWAYRVANWMRGDQMRGRSPIPGCGD